MTTNLVCRFSMEGSKAKSLIVLPWYPRPETIGANMRTLNFVRFFKQYADLDIVYSRCSGRNPSMESRYFSNCYQLEQRAYPSDFLGRCLLAIRGIPYPIREYRLSALRRLFDLIEANDYRSILVRYCRSANGLFNLPEKFRRRTILDFDDVLSGYVYASYFKAEGGGCIESCLER